MKRKKASSKRQTIIITDDHPMVAQGLVSIIHEFTNYDVLAIATDGNDLLHKLNTLHPDMVLLDINMPNINGIQAAIILKKRYSDIKVVMISMYGQDALRQLKDKAEVDGYISKMSEGSLIVKTITQIMKGKNIFLKSRRDAQSKPAIKDNFLEKIKLTARQAEILHLIKNGLTSKDISDKLFLSILTINTHRKNICKKLEITSPNALVKWAHENEF